MGEEQYERPNPLDILGFAAYAAAIEPDLPSDLIKQLGRGADCDGAIFRMTYKFITD